jgi:MFS family permease
VNAAGAVRPFYGWRLVAVLWLVMAINLALPLYGLSFLNVHMADEFGLSRTWLALVYSSFMVMTGLPGPLVARLIDRIGIRGTMVAGNLLLVACAVAMATVVQSPLALLLVAGIGIGLADAIGGPIPAQAAATFWFVRRRALALAIILSGSTVGGIVGAPLLEHVVAAAGGEWRAGWWLIAAMGLVAVAVSHWLVVDRPDRIGQHPDGTLADVAVGQGGRDRSRVYVTRDEWEFGEVLRSSRFWLLMACAAGFSAAYVIFLAQGVLQMRDLGYSTRTAAWVMSAAVTVGLVAHMGTGVLGDRIEPRLLWAAALFVQAAGIVLLAFAVTPALLYASVACLGIGGSSCMVCMVTLLGNWFGARAYAAVFGLASAVQSTLGAAAPILAGWWFDRTGSFVPVFLGTGAACALGGSVILILRPPARPASPKMNPREAMP